MSGVLYLKGIQADKTKSDIQLETLAVREYKKGVGECINMAQNSKINCSGSPGVKSLEFCIHL